MARAACRSARAASSRTCWNAFAGGAGVAGLALQLPYRGVEPSPADVVQVTEADVTFTNHLLLEEQALIRAVDANVAPGTPNVSLAEASETYGANVMPLVEDIGLDVLWLGLRVRGAGEERGATRTSEVQLTPTALEGPGELTLYLTQALGQPEVYWDSSTGSTTTT